MVNFPNAKINLGLNIVEKRPDGFHNLETIFYPIPLSDVLEIIRNEEATDEKVTLHISGMDIPGASASNLCVKAYHLLDNDFDLSPVHIYLHKITPMGAGLGGGSSDGAYALTLLNRVFDLNLSTFRLKEYASQLGSDCAFFIENHPAYGTGKGNQLSPVDLNLKGYYFVLVKPPVFVGTAEAYAGIHPSHPTRAVNELIQLPVSEWKDVLVNDFEQSIFAKHPEIKAIKDSLYQQGAVYASMSGSGSSVFGIFKDEIDLKSAYGNCFYWGGWL